LPGTDLYDEVRDQLIGDDPELFDCYHTLFPTRLAPERFYERLAGLLVNASARTAGSDDGAPNPSVFYFSNDDAFGRMVRAVRDGHLMSAMPTPQAV
jgi:methyltransferase